MERDESSIDIVARFVQHQQSELSRSEIASRLDGPERKLHPNLGEIEVFTGSIGEFWVGTATQTIVTYSAPPRFTPTEAKEYARTYLLEHVPDFDTRNFVQTNGEMRDPLWLEEYREEPKAGEVSIFANWIVLQVHLDRRSAHYFNASNLRRVRTSPTKIDESSAERMALEQHPDFTIESLKLMEHTSDGGRTFQTIWNVTLSPDDSDSPRKLFSIDADTGNVVPQ